MAVDRDEAVRLAVAKAEADGWDLAAFGAPVAARGDDGWRVRFEGVDPSPGNHFVVAVDDATGEVVLWPGR